MYLYCLLPGGTGRNLGLSLFEEEYLPKWKREYFVRRDKNIAKKKNLKRSIAYGLCHGYMYVGGLREHMKEQIAEILKFFTD